MDVETKAYLDTIDRLEPDITPIDTTGALASIAISLKRIADTLDKAVSEPEITINAHTHANLTNLAWEIGRHIKSGMGG